jgi:hypothetical protein
MEQVHPGIVTRKTRFKPLKYVDFKLKWVYDSH